MTVIFVLVVTFIFAKSFSDAKASKGKVDPKNDLKVIKVKAEPSVQPAPAFSLPRHYKVAAAPAVIESVKSPWDLMMEQQEELQNFYLTLESPAHVRKAAKKIEAIARKAKPKRNRAAQAAVA